MIFPTGPHVACLTRCSWDCNHLLFRPFKIINATGQAGEPRRLLNMSRGYDAPSSPLWGSRQMQCPWVIRAGPAPRTGKSFRAARGRKELYQFRMFRARRRKTSDDQTNMSPELGLTASEITQYIATEHGKRISGGY